MPTFRVFVTVTHNCYVDVEAENVEEADKIFEKEYWGTDILLEPNAVIEAEDITVDDVMEVLD